jgi:hypothetical protein
MSCQNTYTAERYTNENDEQLHTCLSLCIKGRFAVSRVYGACTPKTKLSSQYMYGS